MSFKEKLNIGVFIFFSFMFILIIALLSLKIKNLYDENSLLRQKLTEENKTNERFRKQIENTIKQLSDYEKKISEYEQSLKNVKYSNPIKENQVENKIQSSTNPVEEERKRREEIHIKYILSMLYGEKGDDALEKNKIKEAAINYYNSLSYYDNLGARIGAKDILRRTNKENSTLKDHNGSVKSLVFSNKGDLLASGSIDRTIKIWDIREKKLITTFKGHTGTINGLDFSSDDNLLISGSSDKTLKLWSIKENRLIKSFDGHTDSVRTVKFLNNKLVVSGGWDNSVKIWNIETGECIQTFLHTDDINTIDVYPPYILFAGRSQFIRFINYNTYKQVRSFMTKDDIINSIAGNGDYLAVAFDRLFSDDYSISIYDFDSGNFLKYLTGHEAVVNQVVFSKRRNFLISGSSDARVKIWDLATGKCIKTYMEYDASIYTVAISPDDYYIVGGDSTGSIYIWETGINLSIQETMNILKKFF